MSFVSNILQTWYYKKLYNTKLSHLSCLAIYIYFVLNSLKVKKIGNVTVKNYLNERLLSLLCFIIYGQSSFEKGFM